MNNEPRHCDDYIDDPSAPEPLRKFLDRARAPAHGHLITAPFPKLFATVATDRLPAGLGRGALVRVVMASRMGDVGITRNLTASTGYTARVAVADLDDFSAEPPEVSL